VPPLSLRRATQAVCHLIDATDRSARALECNRYSQAGTGGPERRTRAWHRRNRV